MLALRTWIIRYVNPKEGHLNWKGLRKSASLVLYFVGLFCLFGWVFFFIYFCCGALDYMGNVDYFTTAFQVKVLKSEIFQFEPTYLQKNLPQMTETVHQKILQRFCLAPPLFPWLTCSTGIYQGVFERFWLLLLGSCRVVHLLHTVVTLKPFRDCT